MPDDVRKKGEDGLGQFGPALFAWKALPFVSYKKKMPMPHYISGLVKEGNLIGDNQRKLSTEVIMCSYDFKWLNQLQQFDRLYLRSIDLVNCYLTFILKYEAG